MELEIKVLWCRGLTFFNFFQKHTVYATVSIHSQDERIQLSQEQKQEQKTPVDEDGDVNPEWNYTMNFNLKSLPMIENLQSFCLLIEIRNRGQMLGDRTIGEVRVTLKDLIESVGFGVVRFASYEVRGTDGKPNGILDFSYKVGGHYNSVSSGSGSDIQISGYNNNYYYHHEYDHSGQYGLSISERIDYPKIDFNGCCENPVPSATPLLGGYENGQFQNYPYPVSATVTSATHYPHPSYPPQWAPPPPPPPRLEPLAYRPPPPPPPPPYEDPYWGHRPPPDHYYQHSSCGYENHYW